MSILQQQDAEVMLLAIDIGNSNVVIGVYQEDRWAHVWRLPTLDATAIPFYEQRLGEHFLEHRLAFGGVEQVVLSSVVPNLTRPWVQLCTHFFGEAPLLVHPEIYPALSVRIDRPNELGTDLLANAVAAHHYYPGQHCLVVDFGTALTFTTVTDAGQLLGVAIAPGLKTAIEALFQKTAQLPEVPLELPTTPIGKSTAHAIQSGVLLGYVGLVRHLLAAIRAELGAPCLALATGGLASILEPLQDDFDYVWPELTLEGLRIIAQQVGAAQA